MMVFTVGLVISTVACSETKTASDQVTPTTKIPSVQEVQNHSGNEVQQETLEESSEEPTEHSHTHEHLEELNSNYLSDYTIFDTVFGTETTVTVVNDSRIITTNALPDHETGDFPNAGNPNTISAQSSTYEYTTNPVNTGSAKEVHVPGVAVNGVKFEPGTAETVTCASGETYRVEGLQEVFNLGMDFNNAHVQPTGAYHYHGLSELLAETHNESGRDLIHVGFAADGYLMYISTSGAYSPSYQLSTISRTGSNCVLSLGNHGQGRSITVEGTTPDGSYTSDWGYVTGLGDLDECNGTVIDGQYAYIITDNFPYISRCLKGDFTEIRPMGPGGPQTGPPPRNNNR